MTDPRDLRGGFPRFQVLDEPPGFGRFVALMRRAQDLAVAADAPDWNAAADLVDDDWRKDMDKRGFNGQQLFDCAKGLIQKHSK